MSERTSGPGESPFPPATLEQWRALAEKSLRGRNPDELASVTLEGITLDPLLTAAEEPRLSHLGGAPGASPFVRGPSARGAGERPWLKRIDLALPLPARWGAAAADHLKSGATALGVMLDRASRSGLDPDMERARGIIGRSGMSLASAADLALALDGVDLQRTPLFIEAGGAGLQVAGLLCAEARRRGLEPTQLHGSLSCDPLGELAEGGALPVPMSQAYDEMAALMSWAADHAPSMRIAMVHLHPYHDAGGSAVHELAFALATGAEYLAAMTDRGLDADRAAALISFSFSVGPRLFAEMAKLRAARLLWSQVCEAFGCSPGAGAMRIHARSSRYAMTVRDPWTNLLRGTLTAFAAVAARADCIAVAPFDAPLGPSSAFSRRLARNTQLILELESHLGWVTDPAGGSWAVEHLTDGIARQAWALFQRVEALGGMSDALAEGLPQREIATLAATRRQAVATAEQTLVGVNRFALPDEERPRGRAGDLSGVRSERLADLAQLRSGRDEGALDEALQKVRVLKAGAAAEQVDAAAMAASLGATVGEMTAALRHEAGDGPRIEPLHLRRAGEDYDLLREAADTYLARHGERPKALLCGLGPLPHRRVRQELTADVVRAGGMLTDELEVDESKSAQEVAQAVLARRPRAVLLCGSDAAYARLVAPVTAALKAADPRLCVGLAGADDEQGSLAAAGVDLFLGPGVDRVKTIRTLQRELGVML